MKIEEKMGEIEEKMGKKCLGRVAAQQNFSMGQAGNKLKKKKKLEGAFLGRS